MRNLLMAVVTAGLLAASSPGVINVAVVADGPVVDGKVQLEVGATTTVRIMAQSAGGIFSMSGDVVANLADPTLLTSNADSWSIPVAFNPFSPPYPPHGEPGPNGGWINWAVQQPNYLNPDPNIGVANYVEVFEYTVTATAPGPGDVHLMPVLHAVDGYKPMEVNKGTILGTLTGVTIHVVPEPATLCLLALGGMLVARRRRT